MANIRAEFGGFGTGIDLNSSAVANQRSRRRTQKSCIEVKKAKRVGNDNNNAFKLRSKCDRNVTALNYEGNEPQLQKRKTNCKNIEVKNAKFHPTKLKRISYYSSDSDDTVLSSGSSIDTDDLDFDYQYQQSCKENDLIEESYSKPRKHKLDLVSFDVFTDFSSDSDNCESSFKDMYLEPASVQIRRE